MNKQNVSQRKKHRNWFCRFLTFSSSANKADNSVKLEKKKVAFRESKVQKMECIKANYSKSSCQWLINTTVINASLYTHDIKVYFAANSITSIVTRHPCMQDTPYLTLPFSLLSEIFSVFGFAKYAPIMFGKTVHANKTCDHEVCFLSVAD